ncbi:target of rapamycin complex 2 subunit MAPKAP1 isoform X2 [Nematostella vectensis]|uniref:target of rapamycin complex 2 subunit MAPKAP1 isoform X2 n=1 Tax=Nematostella vectensis TaxID=45351 RepID=UPI002076FC76|nr:target of rapamycin complex 2 subunit MAPKAP1 isoform X2 [Nematostella vectensis]
MAFSDDGDFIISLIRHSCVTSDDTGVSEMVIVNEEVENEKTKQRRKLVSPAGRFLPDVRDVMDISSYSQSFDIAVSPSISLIDQKPLKDPTKKENGKKEASIKTIPWKETQEVSENEISDVFSKRPVKLEKRTTSSQLSKQLEESRGKPNNPFLKYSKFDGEAYQRTCPTRKLRIFLTMLDEDERIIPMFVTVLGTATVQDLIGLIMYKYTAESLDPPLKDNLNHYCLMIAEDDGEVDTDFPALDRKEIITKFGFTSLALVEVKKEGSASKQAAAPAKQDGGVIVKVSEPRQGFSRIKVDSIHAKMKVVYQSMVKKRRLLRTGHEYVLERLSEPGVAVDLEATLESMGTLEFVLTRGNRKRDISDKEDGDGVKFDFTSYQYESYRGVYMMHKLRTVTEIQLGVSHENIEIDPLTTPRTVTSRFWPVIRQKPVSLDISRHSFYLYMCVCDSCHWISPVHLFVCLLSPSGRFR